MTNAQDTAPVTDRAAPPRRPGRLSGLWQRQLLHYPDNGPRMAYLAIVVLVTVTLYYELYVQGAVATSIMSEYGMSFTYFVYVAVAGGALGAFASLIAGLADRWGRANLVVYGSLVTGLLTLLGLPNAPDKTAYLALFGAVSFVEGTILVTAPMRWPTGTGSPPPCCRSR